MEKRTYIAIDLKSFYASVECVERKFDPLTTNLVVADMTRTEKTICLAVTPSLKAYRISGRTRLFEVVQRVKAINKEGLPPQYAAGMFRRAKMADTTSPRLLLTRTLWQRTRRSNCLIMWPLRV